MLTISTPAKKAATEHYSFWLRPDTMDYIRKTNNLTRIPQGQLIQLIVDHFRLTRTMSYRKLTAEESERLSMVKTMISILPI